MISRKSAGCSISLARSLQLSPGLVRRSGNATDTRSFARISGCRATQTTGVIALTAADLLVAATRAASAGAEIVREALDKPRQVSFKGATDLVTETDKASELAVLQVLRETFPGHAILGEEGGVVGDTSSEYLWIVDPLDGTTNFTHAYPSFAVSVGVLKGSTPVAGVVIEFTGGPGVWTTRTFTAHKGGGAFCNGKKLHCSNVSELRRSLLVTGFGYDHNAAWSANMQLFKDFTDEVQGVRRLGAASVDLCHVALGVVDGYWEYSLKPWDVCAGVLVVEEAGGTVTAMDGGPYSVFSRSVLASNTLLHQQMMSKTKPNMEGLVESGLDMGPWMVPEGYAGLLPEQ